LNAVRSSLKATSYTTVGLDLVVSILFGFLGGRWLDGHFGTGPWLMIAGLLCGSIAGFRFLFRAAAKMQREAERDGFKASRTGRSARYALDQKDDEGR
jgi:F0F1-type ATP synthase assembly protein I